MCKEKLGHGTCSILDEELCLHFPQYPSIAHGKGVDNLADKHKLNLSGQELSMTDMPWEAGAAVCAYGSVLL